MLADTLQLRSTSPLKKKKKKKKKILEALIASPSVSA